MCEVRVCIWWWGLIWDLAEIYQEATVRRGIPVAYQGCGLGFYQRWGRGRMEMAAPITIPSEYKTQPFCLPLDQPQGPRNTGILSSGLWYLQYYKTKLRDTEKGWTCAFVSEEHCQFIQKDKGSIISSVRVHEKMELPVLIFFWLLRYGSWDLQLMQAGNRNLQGTRCLSRGMGTPNIDHVITRGGKIRSRMLYLKSASKRV